MAITLEEAKKNVQDDLQMGVIDEFQKSNYILEHIPFDDAVSPTVRSIKNMHHLR